MGSIRFLMEKNHVYMYIFGHIGEEASMHSEGLGVLCGGGRVCER